MAFDMAFPTPLDAPLAGIPLLKHLLAEFPICLEQVMQAVKGDGGPYVIDVVFGIPGTNVEIECRAEFKLDLMIQLLVLSEEDDTNGFIKYDCCGASKCAGCLLGGTLEMVSLEIECSDVEGQELWPCNVCFLMSVLKDC